MHCGRRDPFPSPPRYAGPWTPSIRAAYASVLEVQPTQSARELQRVSGGSAWSRLRLRQDNHIAKPRPPSRSSSSSRPRRVVSTWLRWWTRSQPIRTLAQIPLTFALLNTRPPFVYQQVAEKASELSRLGMSACAIAKILRITDKTVTKSLRYCGGDPKDTEPSA